jgi:DNA-directed RNA polymerase subunit RPC12/RpoP
MSEFKFACPVCGQHIRCASDKAGTPMECPTCYRKIIVPQAPSAQSPNLILTAAQATTRPLPQSTVAPLAGMAATKKFPVAAVALLIILCAVAASAIAFREKILQFVQNQPPAGTNAAAKKKHKVVTPPVAPPANDTNWTLSLAEAMIPDTPAAGRVHGRDFLSQRVTLQGGKLDLRQGAAGLTIQLFAKQGEDLAGQCINIESSRTNSPKVTLRWKDAEEEKAKTKNLRSGYALRLEFGRVTGKRLPGRIYLCTPDEAKSYVAGTFTAEIRTPPPPKSPPPPTKPKP